MWAVPFPRLGSLQKERLAEQEHLLYLLPNCWCSKFLQPKLPNSNGLNLTTVGHRTVSHNKSIPFLSCFLPGILIRETGRETNTISNYGETLELLVRKTHPNKYIQHLPTHLRFETLHLWCDHWRWEGYLWIVALPEHIIQRKIHSLMLCAKIWE